MKISRRSFFKYTIAAIAAVPLASALSPFGIGTAEAADLPMAKETEEPAKTLKYCPNADKPSANCAARKAKDKQGQYCHNCQLYTATAEPGKSGKGKCMIIPGKRVEGGGWCGSWVKKPA